MCSFWIPERKAAMFGALPRPDQTRSSMFNYDQPATLDTPGNLWHMTKCHQSICFTRKSIFLSQMLDTAYDRLLWVMTYNHNISAPIDCDLSRLYPVSILVCHSPFPNHSYTMTSTSITIMTTTRVATKTTTMIWMIIRPLLLRILGPLLAPKIHCLRNSWHGVQPEALGLRTFPVILAVINGRFNWIKPIWWICLVNFG